MIRIRSFLFLFVVTQASCGCSFSFQSWQYASAVRLAEKHDYAAAVDKFSRVVRRDPDRPIAIEASRRGARIAAFETRNYTKATDFYRHLVLYSSDPAERLGAQKSLVELYFDKLFDYNQAVIELHRLLPLLAPKDRGQYQLFMAKAQYNLNNFTQALSEVDDLLARGIGGDLRFDALHFKGNLLQAAKRLPDAIAILGEMQSKFPDRSRKENIGLSLAVCLEEMGELKRAVAVLEDVKEYYSTPDFIQVRINNLKGRMANLPGAQGLNR